MNETVCHCRRPPAVIAGKSDIKPATLFPTQTVYRFRRHTPYVVSRGMTEAEDYQNGQEHFEPGEQIERPQDDGRTGMHPHQDGSQPV